ncbi:uncharacterized protein PG986_006408 [Apiospora aurea]|uniref:Uncharacterized protein n=1 Tax=Apiospora aurea TaxID=335848 RepID=A0ABR1QKB5_9PEZI
MRSSISAGDTASLAMDMATSPMTRESAQRLRAHRASGDIRCVRSASDSSVNFSICRGSWASIKACEVTSGIMTAKNAHGLLSRLLRSVKVECVVNFPLNAAKVTAAVDGNVATEGQCAVIKQRLETP